MKAIPAESGTYALFLTCSQKVVIRIGRLGQLLTQPGVYVYIGSAHGPGGLRARIGHHWRISPRPRWHVDYLRAILRPVAVWVTCDPTPREHQWAQLIGRTRGAGMPLAGFGASDCRCRTHLYHFAHMPNRHTFRKNIYNHVSGHEPITGIVLESTDAPGKHSKTTPE